MLKLRYKLVISMLSLYALIVVAVLIWRASHHFTYLSDLLANTGTDKDLNVEQGKHDHKISASNQIDGVDDSLIASNAGHYETIEETIARIQRDVIVTGSITGIPGEESAIFQIEGMPDQLFRINTQLMDGFIIIEITNNHVALKNQSGNETIVMSVQSGKP